MLGDIKPELEDVAHENALPSDCCAEDRSGPPWDSNHDLHRIPRVRLDQAYRLQGDHVRSLQVDVLRNTANVTEAQSIGRREQGEARSERPVALRCAFWKLLGLATRLVPTQRLQQLVWLTRDEPAHSEFARWPYVDGLPLPQQFWNSREAQWGELVQEPAVVQMPKEPRSAWRGHIRDRREFCSVCRVLAWGIQQLRRQASCEEHLEHPLVQVRERVEWLIGHGGSLQG